MKIRNPVIQRYEEMKQHLLVAFKFLSHSRKHGEDLNKIWVDLRRKENCLFAVYFTTCQVHWYIFH